MSLVDDGVREVRGARRKFDYLVDAVDFNRDVGGCECVLWVREGHRNCTL